VSAATDGPWAGRRLHFVGIGGAGMSGWARVALQLGAAVSGTDRADSPVLARLAAAGAQVHVGHDAAHVPPGAEVVFSTAVPADNPERAVARANGWPERPRAELLRELTGSSGRSPWRGRTARRPPRRWWPTSS
jgi:UDP-N-acetylmuramate--alanine ligase